MRNKIWNDAGLLREYIIVNYTDALLAGGNDDVMAVLYRNIRRLVTLSGLDIDIVVSDLLFDAEQKVGMSIADYRLEKLKKASSE